MYGPIFYILIILVSIFHIFAINRRIKLIRENEKENKRELLRYKIITDVLSRNFESKQEQLDYVLNEALKLTDSQYGYLYIYDENNELFSLNSWTHGVMADCDITEKFTKYQIHKTGIWGDVLKQRKAIISNNFNEPYFKCS